MSNRVSFGDDALGLVFTHDRHHPVRLATICHDGVERAVYQVPAVEVLAVGHGHRPASGRLAHTRLGGELRYVSHQASDEAGERTLVIRQSAPEVAAELRLRQVPGVAAVTATLTLSAVGRPLVLQAVPSFCCGFTTAQDPDDPLAGWELLRGRSDWLGEGRWSANPLRGGDLPDLSVKFTGSDPRGSFGASSTGTWSTGGQLPVAGLENSRLGAGLAWQVEHNGPWRWEVADDRDGGYLALSGPTDAHAAWSRALAPAESFTTVAVTLAFGPDLTGALGQLTRHRRARRREHPDNRRMPVVFNDYMNTLDGDPTTEKLLPLVDAAAEVGAEIFCIDAGWYDETGHWWDSVGEWRPSRTRFPSGLGEVIDAIRGRGMVPGLWLEPEVVGVNSPVAATLPAEAFLQRHGERVVEHERHHLDLRHPAAVAHLDAVVDRLVDEFGIGFFKFDYNIDPGAGTDLHADSPGDGLLGHNRAHLDWLDTVLARHPALVVENCSSGAMRADWAMLSRLAMQSTSDQQDFTKYPPICAAAPLLMLPEQAANWAYPQPGMTAEEVSFCLVTGLLGRFYVSGHLNRAPVDLRARVARSIAVAKELRPTIQAGEPFWPLGLPGWDDPWVALGLRAGAQDLLSIWRRSGDRSVTLRLPHRAGTDLHAETLFPTDLPAWTYAWDPAAATLTIRTDDTTAVSARTVRLS